jgi:hypothetical protein
MSLKISLFYRIYRIAKSQENLAARNEAEGPASLLSLPLLVLLFFAVTSP